jgi:hypothetical protein
MIDSTVGISACQSYQRVARAWLRSGDIVRTNHLLSPLEELAGFNFGFVYLLELDGDPPSVKIGFSEHPMRRIRELRQGYRYGEGFRLRACFVGEQQAERALHRRFAHLRIENERFLKSAAIEEAFAQARERMRMQLRDIHLCSPDCPQMVKGVDLRMLHAWLRR